MNITDESIDGAAVAHLEGNLDTTTAPEVMAHLDGLIEAGTTTLIVDFAEGSEESPIARARTGIASPAATNPLSGMRIVANKRQSQIDP